MTRLGAQGRVSMFDEFNEPFTGRLLITGNTTARAGTYELNW